jgi:hypothetical protein
MPNGAFFKVKHLKTLQKREILFFTPVPALRSALRSE